MIAAVSTTVPMVAHPLAQVIAYSIDGVHLIGCYGDFSLSHIRVSAYEVVDNCLSVVEVANEDCSEVVDPEL